MTRPADDSIGAAVAAGRAAVLRTFRWDGGHADVWRVFRDPDALDLVVTGLVAPFRASGISAVLGVESRGFLLGGAVAVRLGAGFVAVRKAGSLFPGTKVRRTTDPDYRGRRHELLVQRAGLQAGDRVLLVDDWVETGSQARTVGRLVADCGAELVGLSVLVDQLGPGTRDGFGALASLVRFEELLPDE